MSSQTFVPVDLVSWFLLSFSFYVGGLLNEHTFDCRQRLLFYFILWLSIQKCLGVLVSDVVGGHTDDSVFLSASLARWQMTEDDEY